MPRRFFAPIDLAADHVEVVGAEAHHLLRVLRLQIGDQVWLFDGRGHEVLAKIVASEKESARLEVIERRSAGVLTGPAITIATAVPKGDRFRWLIEKATELGVHRIVPLVTQRSIVDPGQGKLDKLRQTIVEACKQCGRSQLMELTEPLSWRECVAQEFPGREVWLAHPDGEPFAWHPASVTQPPLFLIGPEGGFTDDEVSEAVSAGARKVQLGPTILRIETAAIAIAALTCIPPAP